MAEPQNSQKKRGEMNSETFVEMDLMYFAGESDGHAPLAICGVNPVIIGRFVPREVGSCRY